MIDNKKELAELSPEAQEVAKKQRSMNRIFWVLCGVCFLLLVILIFEIVVKTVK